MILNQLRSKTSVGFFSVLVWAAYFLSNSAYCWQFQPLENNPLLNGGPEVVDVGMGTPGSFHQVGNTLLIGTEKGLYRWNDKLENTPELIDTQTGGIYHFYQVGSVILIGAMNGLYRWNDKLEGKPELIDSAMGAIYNFYQIDSILLIGSAAGLYRWNDRLEGEPVLVNAEIGGVIQLHQMGGVILVASTGGVYRWNDKLEGKLEFADPQIYPINHFLPVGNALLVGTGVGLYRWNDKLEGKPVLIDSSIGAIGSFYRTGSTVLIGAEKGVYKWNDKLEGKPTLVDSQIRFVYSFYQMGSTLLIGVTGGLFRWNDKLEGRPVIIDSVPGGVSQIHQMGNTILIGAGAGTYRWNDRFEGKPVLGDPQVGILNRFLPVGNVLLVGAEDGLFRWNDKFEGMPDLVDSSIGAIVQIHQMGNTVLIGTTLGLYQWNDRLEGKPVLVDSQVRYPSSFYQMGSTLLIGVAGGLYQWNDKFEGKPMLADSPTGAVYSFHKLGGTLLVGGDKGVYRWNDKLEGKPELIDLPMGAVYSFYQTDSALLIGAAAGLYRWNDKLEGKPELIDDRMGSVIYFRQVGSVLLVGTQTGLFKIDGVGIKWNADIEVTPLPKQILSDNKVSVQWTIKNYEHRANSQNVRIRIILKDRNGEIVTKNASGEAIAADQWLVSPGQSQITMPNLSSGNYILTIQATDLTGNTSESKPIDFKVYSSLEESFLDWGKFLAFLYAVLTVILLLILVLGARRSKRCFDILTDPLTRKLSIYFGFAVRYIRPVQIWIFERYFDELKKDWSGNNIYVPYHLIPSDDKPDGTSADPIESTEIIKQVYDNTRILILGGPGTGKSALVRNLMQNYCQEPSLRSAWKKYGFIPILVRLRELARSQNVKVSELARSALDGKAMTFDKDDSFFESLLRNSDFLIVLDGLNEVNIEGAVDEFAVSHPSVRLLITSQTDSISDSFKRYRLPFFDPEFAKKLLRKFIGDGPAEKAIIEVPELWKEIKCGYDVRLVENLIGSSKTNVHGVETSDGWNTSLPKNRLELYKAMVEFSRKKYEQAAIQIKAFPYVRICEHAWNMWRNGQYLFQPDGGLSQPEIEHLVRTNLALKRPQGYEFMHSLMRDFLSAEFCIRHSGSTKLMIKTRIEGEDADKIWKLPPDDQAPVFSFLTESIDQREDLEQIFQFASEKIKERHQLLIAVQEVAKKKGWQIQININSE